MKEWRFIARIAVEGELETLTGLHIGGGKEGYEIGGLDNPVIKLPIKVEVRPLSEEGYSVPEDSPYIPGSSLKGKMRAMLDWLDEVEGNPHIKFEEKKDEEGNPTGWWEATSLNCDDPKEEGGRENCHICAIFGHPAAEATKLGPTRLLVWDAYPTKETIEDWVTNFGEVGPFTELKWENTIDRLSSLANPRAMERIVPGSKFLLRFDYLLFDGEGRKFTDDLEGFSYLFKGLKSLEQSFLGGNGSRGYGRVRISGLRAFLLKREDYLKGTPGPGEKLDKISEAGEPQKVLENWEEVREEIEERLKNAGL